MSGGKARIRAHMLGLGLKSVGVAACATRARTSTSKATPLRPREQFRGSGLARSNGVIAGGDEVLGKLKAALLQAILVAQETFGDGAVVRVPGDESDFHVAQ